MSDLSTLELGLIIGGGAAVVVGCVIAFYFCVYHKRRRWWSAAGPESSYLMNHDDAPTEVYSSSTSEWKYGELDHHGVKRVAAWLSDVLTALQTNGGTLDPIVEDVIVENTLLGHQDDIGSPPQGYSPRVSNVGSDDGTVGRRGGAAVFARDPLRR